MSEEGIHVDGYGKFIAVDGERAFASADGVTWTQTDGPPVEQRSILKRVWDAVAPSKRDALYSAAVIVTLAAIYSLCVQ